MHAFFPCGDFHSSVVCFVQARQSWTRWIAKQEQLLFFGDFQRSKDPKDTGYNACQWHNFAAKSLSSNPAMIAGRIKSR
jgi:hypothetical protein